MLILRHLRPAFSALAFALTAVSVSTAQTPQLGGEPFSSSIEELRAASVAAPQDRLYDAQVLLEEASYKIGEDGTLSYQHRLIFRVDSPEAVQHWSEISSRWDRWFEKPAQLNARVLAADGHFVTLDQKTITDAPVKAQDDETYSSEHVRRAPLPGVSVGAIVEEVEQTDEKTAYFGNGSLYRFFFQAEVPVQHARMIVDLPAAMPFKDAIHKLPELKVTRDNTGGRRHVVYDQGPQAAAHGSDIELSTNEADGPMVEFATGASWASVASAYAATSEPQTILEDTRPILPVRLPVTRMERIRAVVYALHSNVRYTGVEFGDARLTPMRPSEVIKRHYGDCKDKATLLVAMLRAAGVPANLALLSTGPGRDVTSDLPGMNRFDHAIVYVPANDGAPALWIDATAEFFQPGSLPFPDTGRNALVIAPDTKGLTRTPEAKSSDASIVETRTFTLAGNGPSHVVETSATTGFFDADYRSSYGGPDTEKGKTHEQLVNYVQNAYLAKSLVKVTHGDPTDLSQPFNLTLEIADAKRGDTAMSEAVVVAFPNMVLTSLPRWFKQPGPVMGPDTSPEMKHQFELAQQSRMATYTFEPFTDERRVHVVAPEGFIARALPPNKTTQLATATLTETYTSPSPNVIDAVFHFDSGPATLTAQQALDLRTAAVELMKRDYVGLYFDQVGAKAFADGHIRAALDADRALITSHPADALNHVRLARLLLDAGIGDAAHAEARKATELDPTLAEAWSALGWTLEHDALGVRFGKGYDRDGAISAYRKAIELDPDNNDPRFDLAILYEFDKNGVRYSSDADLKLAIAAYKDLIDRTKDKDENSTTQTRNNLQYALLFHKDFAELDKLLATLPSNNNRAALTIVSTTAQSGVKAGIEASSHGNVSASDRSKNLIAAGELLAQLRMYSEASEILSAGVAGGTDAPTTARQIELYKGLKPASLAPLPATDPARPIQVTTVGILAGTLTREQTTASLAHHAYSSTAALNRDVEKNLQQVGFLRTVAENSEMPEPVLLDIIAGNMTFTTAGDEATGYQIVSQTPGANPTHYFVVKEDGAFRGVADEHDAATVGYETLYALEHNQPKLAKSLLDWKRDLMHKEGGDDPFSGPLLPRFWTVNSSKPGADSPEAMKLAAISLIAGTMDAKPYVAEVAAARDKASGAKQTDLDLLLAYVAIGSEQMDIGLTAAKHLLEQEPDSLTALRLAGEAYAFQADTKSWQAMLKPLLDRKPKDHDLLDEQARVYEAAHDYANARKSYLAAIDTGKAESNDYNAVSWLGLFDNHIGEDTLKQAQQANMVTKNSSFAELHTLACIYAAEGRTTEARQVLKQAMQAGNMPQPNGAVWYALGLIYEQYGANDAALAAYKRVEAHELDDHTYIEPMSTWVLAERRIKALTAVGATTTAAK